MICPTCGHDPEHTSALLMVAVAAGEVVEAGRIDDNLDGIVYSLDNLIVRLNELHEKFSEDANEVS